MPEELISYEGARTQVQNQRFDWGTERISLSRAEGRILAEAIVADRDQPPFDRVAMDGIAIDYRTYAGGQRQFPVERLQPAGAPSTPLLDPGKCIEIMTGAALPPGTTTVIRYEDLEREGEAFLLPPGIDDERNIHRRGTDTRKGEELIPPGTRIGTAAIGMLATCGYAEVTVQRLPRVAIVSTGDEIVGVGERPLDHQIRGSNLHQVAAVLRRAGLQPTLHHLPDAGDGAAKLADLLADHELLLLSGGVSKGKYDHVPGWLTDCGVARLFHRVAQRPGKPLWVGRTERTMVFALPGNPVSSLVGTLAYVLPWLTVNQLGELPEPRLAVLAEPITFRPDLTLFQLVESSVDRTNGGRYVSPVRHAGSGDGASLLRGDGFVVLPGERSTFRAGEVFPFLVLLVY